LGEKVVGSGSIAHWLVVIVVVMIVFGAGRLPKAMSDLGKGIRAFKVGMGDGGHGDGADPATGPLAPPSEVER
jgi:sec-independent protein translocase protein TatA